MVKAEAAILTQAYRTRLQQLLDLPILQDLDLASTPRGVNSLVLAFSIAHQLGEADVAAQLGHLVGLALMTRSLNKPVSSVEDLADLETARTWFYHLGTSPLVAATDASIAVTADKAVTVDVHERLMLLQLGSFHCKCALEYYEKNEPANLESLRACLIRLETQLAAAVQAAAYLEGSREIKDSIAQLSSAMRDGLSALSEEVRASLTNLTHAVAAHGASVASAIVYAGDQASQATLVAGGLLAAGLATQGEVIREAVREGAAALSESMTQASHETRQALWGVGTQLAVAALLAGRQFALGIPAGFAQIASNVRQTGRP